MVTDHPPMLPTLPAFPAALTGQSAGLPGADGAYGADAAEATDRAGQADNLGTPHAAPTGDERIDAALARLAELEQLPVEHHGALFDDVRRRLQEVLSDIDAEELT
jgi:hypothetical protein